VPSTQPKLSPIAAFDLIETTIADIHTAYKAGSLTVRQLVQTHRALRQERSGDKRDHLA
jgi:hypothetical protein